MTAKTEVRNLLPASTLAAQIVSFRIDPPLHHSFPLRLANGVTVPEFTATCGHCGRQVDPEWIHGRIVDAMPAMKTLAASAYCVPCQRLIRLDGRFREVGSGFQFEWADAAGGWSADAPPIPLSAPSTTLATRFVVGR